MPSRSLRSTRTDIGGLRLHARVSASQQSAPAVVLVHGLISSRYFVPTAERLVGSCRVFLPDLPGFGASPVSKAAQDVTGLSDALAAYMSASGLEAAVVVGHSVGSQTVVDLALRYPHLVRRAVLTAPTFDPEARTVTRQYGRWLRNVIREPPSLNIILAREALELGVVRPVRLMRSFLLDHIEDKVGQVAVPTLVVRGELDTISTRSWAERIADLLPLARLAVIPGAPHTVTYSAPVEFSELIRAFSGGGEAVAASRPPAQNRG
ncbi:MAG: alpha/beta hydrolase [Actinobacteria bacterium]|nr:MAG: alpha/beta hydrolase [Actinomycetota bacterium]